MHTSLVSTPAVAGFSWRICTCIKLLVQMHEPVIVPTYNVTNCDSNEHHNIERACICAAGMSWQLQLLISLHLYTCMGMHLKHCNRLNSECLKSTLQCHFNTAEVTEIQYKYEAMYIQGMHCNHAALHALHVQCSFI